MIIDYNEIYNEQPKMKLTKGNCNHKITKNSHIYKEWKSILKWYNIKLKAFNDDADDAAGGWADERNRTIAVNMEGGTKQDFVSIVLHEFAHFLNSQNNKYGPYHKILEKKRWTPEERELVIRTAYKAEKYTDMIARKLMKVLYPDIKYIGGYDETHKKWLVDQMR